KRNFNRKLFKFAERVQCGGVISSETGVYVNTYVCPTQFHREIENRCCDPPQFKCCREASFLENHPMAILSTALIVTCALLTVLIIICLCWEKCLLHKIIRRKPRLDYIG
uniref:FMR1N protein n=1 Tax=Elaeophora elaphi TaxID=1147741 RepID=A0A0R3RZA9_9BILA